MSVPEGRKRRAGSSQRSRDRRQELVAVDARGYTARAVMVFDAHNFRKAANVDVTGHGNFARQGEDEFDGRSGSEVRFHQKVEAAEADVPSLSLPFISARLIGTNR